MARKNVTKNAAIDVAKQIAESPAPSQTKRLAGNPSANTRRGKREQIAHDMAYAWNARVRGKTIKQIASEVGLSTVTVSHYLQLVADELRQLAFQNATQWRTMELEKLDRLEQVLQDKIDAGDIGAIHTALQISRRRFEILQIMGAPQDHQVTIRIVEESSDD